jgi:putative ABC transport system permease protein
MSVSRHENQPDSATHKAQSPYIMPPITMTQRRRGRGGYSLYQSCTSALEALRANKLRALLTSLGIIIGVAAVIVMVAVSESSAAIINGRLAALNPNQLIIRPGSTTTGGVRQGAGTQQTLTEADATAISSQAPNVSAVSPMLNASGQIIFQSENWSTTVQGVYPDYQQIDSWTMQEGSFFSNVDEQSGNSVAVLGQTVVQNLFTPLGIDPIGQQIRIDNVPFTVVGVLASKGSSGTLNADDVIYLPFSTARERLAGTSHAISIAVLVNGQQNMNATQDAIQTLLEDRHMTDDFTIQNQAQILQTAQATTSALTTLLISVAAISLIVGGIGIMNIMLVSVTERTREIGIRIALGAYPRDVMLQFLIEALMLSALGGIVGIVIGIVGAFISATLTGRPLVLDPFAVLLSFVFAAVVGIVFGFYPAQRAARMDPIVALRTE